MDGTQAAYIIGILVYLVVLAALAEWGRRRIYNAEDFWVAGRRLGPLVTGFSYIATNTSASAMMGVVGAVYLFGPATAFWVVIGFSVSYPFIFLVLGPRIRGLSERRGYFTVPDLVRDRYDSKAAGILTAALIICAFVPFMTVQLKGGALIVEAFTGLPWLWALVLFMVVKITYVAMGGMFSVAYSDLIQGVIMVVGAIGVVAVLLAEAGGLFGATEAFVAAEPARGAVFGSLGAQGAIAIALMYTVGSFGTPHTLIRVFSVRRRALPRAMAVTSAANIVFLMFMLAVGVAAFVLDPGIADADSVVPVMIRDHVPLLLGVPFVAALLAAIMSSSDSVLHQIGAALARDIRGRLTTAEPDARTELRYSRGAIVVAGAAAFVFAIEPPELILMVVVWVWGLFGIGIGIPIVGGLLWKGANKTGALACLVAGCTTFVVWEAIGSPMGLQPIYVGLPVGLVAFVAGSLVGPAITPAAAEIFFPPRRATPRVQETGA